MTGSTVKPETDAGNAEDEPAEVEAARARDAFLGDDAEPIAMSSVYDGLSRTERVLVQTKRRRAGSGSISDVSRIHVPATKKIPTLLFERLFGNTFRAKQAPPRRRA